MSAPRITYTSTAADPEFRARFDRELAAVRDRFGLALPCSIGGKPSASGRTRDVHSPIDTRLVLARIEQASGAEVGEAMQQAAAAFPSWRRLGWQKRVELLRAAAERIQARSGELAAWMVYEVGKSRLEAMAEVEESADLLRYYASRMEANDGYRMPLARMAPSEATESVLLPYGAWGVLSPFNFPAALAAGMLAGALVTGNTVVFKPSQDAPISGALLCEELWAAGVPRDVLHLVMGPGEEVGQAILDHPALAGVAFTGSLEVGMKIVRGLHREWPRPVVVEMGGKNPAIVTARTDLDAAAEAVARSAFGFGGQKCSACSRVYVVAEVAAKFIARLTARCQALTVGDPAGGDPFLGPLIHTRAVESFEHYVEGIRAAGGEVLAGGAVLDQGELAYGHYVQPTLAWLPDPHHPYFSEEMFLPILLVAPVADLEEAIEESNRAPYGLTAGLFSDDSDEVRRFLDGIEAGVLYVNRRSGATTGAWPGINSFGGWKGSGGTGVAALGPHYLLKFLREQSRTINGVEI
jgi:1-pyrroline-5-carboxylate dehydrogenase